MSNFSESEYVNILKRFTHMACRFGESGNSQQAPIYFRHDVEADLEKAVYLSKLNARESICGLFTIQVVSEFYNIFSNSSRKYIEELVSNGQDIGLHYYSEYRENDEFDFLDFDWQVKVLDSLLEKLGASKVSAFSYHRPTYSQLLASQRKTGPEGYIDCYGPAYFELTDDPYSSKTKYLSDSDHEWRYGHPLDVEIDTLKSLQILMHPEEWPLPNVKAVYQSIEEVLGLRTRAALATEYKKYDL